MRIPIVPKTVNQKPRALHVSPTMGCGQAWARGSKKNALRGVGPERPPRQQDGGLCHSSCALGVHAQDQGAL